MKIRKILSTFLAGTCLLGANIILTPSAKAAIQEKTPEQWAAESITETYAPNREITGAYDKTLAIKCQNGIFVGYLDDDVLTFKGIPYATQPVGKLRWKKPEPPAKSNKVFEALHSGKTPVQPGNDIVGTSEAYASGEDCLTLNVFVNKNSTTKKKPVMVWIHGGAYTSGSTAQPLYNGKNLITNNPDVILVTTTYRLGVLGFANFADIKGGNNYPDINLGTLDQIAALKWVKNNIAAFGGDPDCVTVFGESAGGGSISILCIHPKAKGLFRRAIIQSGAVSHCMPEKESTFPVNALAKHFNAKNMDDLVAIPPQELSDYWAKYCGSTANFVVAEKKTVSDNPFDLWKKGRTKNIEILQGAMANEWRLFVSMFGTKEFFDAHNKFVIDSLYKDGKSKKYTETCNKYRTLLKQRYGEKWADTEFISDQFFVTPMFYQAKQHSKNGGKGYVYVMNQPSDLPEMKACHGTDLFFVFGNFDGQMVNGTVEQQELSAAIQKMWVSFAKTGNPSTQEHSWPQYDEKKQPVMMIGTDMHIENNPDAERRALTEKMWDFNPAYRYSKTLAYTTTETIKANPQLVTTKK